MGYKVNADLDALGVSPAAGDFVPVVDISDTTQAATGSTKKVTITNFANAVSSLLSLKPLTTKGDLYTYSTDADRLAVGSNDYLLTADSTEDEGIKWAWEVLDEDDMASDSAAKLSTQQSIKAYVDSLLVVTGWVNSSDSWTYASATTITVPAGAASIYNKGDKIRLKQGGGYKYWYVAIVANTVLTIALTNDYTLADAAITDNSYSKVVNPLDFPHWMAYDPTWTGFSADPTLDLNFQINGGKCTIISSGTSGTSNAAALDFTLPISATGLPPSSLNQAVIVQNNGSWQNQTGILGIGIGSAANAVAKVGLVITSRAANAYGGFTASGTKGFEGVFHYDI